MGCNGAMTDQSSLDALPPGATAELAAELAAALDRLFVPTADGQARYLAARHVLWQAIATMMAKGMEDEAALQMVVSATTELLTRAAGPAGAAAHLRLMADKVASLPE